MSASSVVRWGGSPVVSTGSAEWTRFGALAHLLTVPVFWAIAGARGIALALALFALGGLTTGLLTFAVAHVGLLAAVPVLEPLPFVLCEMALAPLLLVDMTGLARQAVAALVFAAALVALVVLSRAGYGTVAAVGALVATVALASYLVHRYEFVALGLVEDETGGDSDV